MKRFSSVIAVLLIVFMLAAFASCASKPSGDTGEDLTGKPFSADKDMAIIVGGKKYQVRVDSAQILADLGDGYEYGETVSCLYNGYDKTFAYDDLIVSTVPDGDADIIEMFTITGKSVTTARGITVGATKDEVITAYGEKYWFDGYMNYTESGDETNISENRVQFQLENDVVTQIYVYSPSYSN